MNEKKGLVQKGRILLIGVDGATWRVLRPWARSGKLPNFRRIMEEGVHGPLASTLPPNSPPAWTSIFTGSNPGRHGIFGFVKRKKGSYFVTPISSKDRKVPPIWKTLSEAGRRCVLLNIPFSYPPDALNGIMTTGLGTPSRDSEFIYPKKMKKEILDRFPDYDVDFNEDQIELGSEKDPLGKIKRVTEAQAALAKHLFMSQKWDVFSIVFRSIDVVQHYYWKRKDILLNFYRQMDEFIGWIIEHMDPMDIMVICSDHGFSPVIKCINVNNWLESLGLFHIKKRSEGKGRPRVSAEKVQTVLLKVGLRDLVWRLKRSDLLEPVLRDFLKSEKTSYMFDIEWSRTRAYLVEASLGLVNLNLKGREPEGIVGPKEKDQILDQLVLEATKLLDPQTGKRVFAGAYKAEEVFKGGSDETPDLVLVSAQGYRLVCNYNRNQKLLEKETLRYGEHEHNGILLAFGKGVQKGLKFEGAQVFDLTPTILYILGIPGPSHIDGKILKDIFDDDFNVSRKAYKVTETAQKRTQQEMERIKRVVGRIK